MTQKPKDLLGSVPQMAVWPTLEAKAASAFLTHLVDVWGSLLLHYPLGWPFCTRQNPRPNWGFNEPSYFFFSILLIPIRLFCVTLSLHSIGFLAVFPFLHGDQKSVMGACPY